MIKIIGVVSDTPAAKAGVMSGEYLCAVGGRAVRDLLDYRFFTTERLVTLTLKSEEGTTREVRIKKGQYDDLGLEFDSFLMDKQQACKNACVFCFIDQLPKGLRPSLYFKDDDERLSFLFGNFVTMTNLTDHEIDRIIEMRISPIHISVHTTDPNLRVRMMKNPAAATSLQYLKRLAGAGIGLQTQIVLCPDWNDGEHLKRTLRDLCALGEHLQGVAVVPIGLTAHREGLSPMRPFTPTEAAEVIDTIEQFGDRLLCERGERIVHPADEFFLLAGRKLPPPEYYDGFGQIEDGVGLISALREEFDFALEDTPPKSIDRHVTLATGKAAAPFMRELAGLAMRQFKGLSVEVVAVENRLFGPLITVAGLVCGEDLLHALTPMADRLGDVLLLPTCMLRREGDMFLDDKTPQDLASALEVDVTMVDFGGQALLDAMLGM